MADQEAYATFLDFEKAYDRVYWSYLFRVLETFGIGSKFIARVRLLYNKSIAKLVVNGELTSNIYPNRGVKQGDPLSSLLFVLAIEPLAAHLRQVPEHGLQIGPRAAATSILFADGCTLLSGTKDGLDRQLDIVHEYCLVSGARLNRAKCKTLALSSKRPPPDWDGHNAMATGTHVKYLGICFGHDMPTSKQAEALVQRFYVDSSSRL
ncbi:hypothetical protein ACHHYP_07670 [Achlya hypogyna]|uniref:Reverse transcriptase domain-containing protein n=1 Tax=Achlya hypogyna TaxID=1202772 RepID=A0A1V9YR55_ACHHY|nr:hypothetical protein ACHHYP_07670 [Achlya hypogyna]